ncbi:hypothetical protein [Streptomyces armeniacus]|nr:hypothetical protein [Streptomyces armeniacus]
MPPPIPVQTPPSAPGPSVPAAAGSGDRSSRGRVIGIVAGSVIAGAGLAVGAMLLFGGGDDDNSSDDNAKPAPSKKSSAPASGGPRPGLETPGSEPAEQEVNPTSGIKLPILDGWEQSTPNAAGGDTIETGLHPCEDDKEATCTRGQVSVHRSSEDRGTKMTLKEIAERDVKKQLKNSFGVEGNTHEVAKSEQVVVTTESGYRVRWKISDKSGPMAYLESVVFPSPHDDGSILIFHIFAQIHPKAPSIEFSEQLLIKTQKIPRTDRGGEGDTI